MSMVSEAVEFIYCACGCGFTTSKYKIEKNGKVRYDVIKRYINRHARRGMKHSPETLEKMSEAKKGEKHQFYHKHLSKEHRQRIGNAQRGEKSHWFGKHHTEEWKERMHQRFKGENNPLWKGDKLTTEQGLHYRIKTMKPKPALCEMCNLVPPQELSNKSGLYSLTDLTDWQWVCIRCHRRYDNNYEKNFKRHNDEKRLIAQRKKVKKG